MKRMHVTSLLALILVCSSIGVGADKRARTAQRPADSTGPEVKAPSNPAIANTSSSGPEPGANVVQYGEKDVIKVKAKLRFTTLIVLPKDEQILDFMCGDKEFWIVNGSQNFASVKPAKAGSQTNLNLITASGNIYSFVFSEISELPNAEPDLKVFVQAKEESMIAAATSAPKFVSAEAAEGLRREAAAAQEATRQAKASAQEAIDTGIARFVANVRFPYRFDAGKKPFFVRAMYHDERFTYIQARPEETPTLYEVRDGAPNLVNFRYENGVYVVDKILEKGYLAIGKQKLGFLRQE